MKRLYFTLLTASGLLSMVFLYQNCGEFENIDTGDSTTSEDTQFRTSANENTQAITLYRRLAGVTLGIDHPTIKEMEALIVSGDTRGAAAIAASEAGFLNITVRDFATKMSTREQTVSGPMNDFVATVIGSVRDNVPAISMMTGNYYYRAQGVTDVRQDLINDIISTNNHYDDLEQNVDDIQSVLIREDGQKVLDQGGNVSVLRDAAGLMTTRGWMSVHANAGTNRRLIEYAFKIFACTPIEEWASTNRPDSYVGRDVAREPFSEYQTKCKSCHSGMDAIRPATAYFDFSEDDGTINYRFTYQRDPNPDNGNLNVDVPAAEQLVPYKFRRATDAFPGGFVVRNTNWQSYASNEQFGFKSAPSGTGFNSFARYLANSQGFSRCMVERAFKTVCRQDLDEGDRGILDQLAAQFENNGYNMKEMFIDVSVHPSCLGLEL